MIINILISSDTALKITSTPALIFLIPRLCFNVRDQERKKEKRDRRKEYICFNFLPKEGRKQGWKDYKQRKRRKEGRTIASKGAKRERRKEQRQEDQKKERMEKRKEGEKEKPEERKTGKKEEKV